MNGHAGFMRKILPRLLVKVLARLDGNVLSGLLVQVTGDIEIVVAFHLLGTFTGDLNGFIALDLFHPVLLDDDALVVSDPLARIVLDASVVIHFAAKKNLLTTGLVLEAQLVVIVIATALGAAGLDCASRLVIRQCIGNGLFCVVDAASDDGAVRITVDEAHQYLLAYTRNGDNPPTLAGPLLRDADAAGTPPCAVPGETHN